MLAMRIPCSVVPSCYRIVHIEDRVDIKRLYLSEAVDHAAMWGPVEACRDGALGDGPEQGFVDTPARRSVPPLPTT